MIKIAVRQLQLVVLKFSIRTVGIWNHGLYGFELDHSTIDLSSHYVGSFVSASLLLESQSQQVLKAQGQQVLKAQNQQVLKAKLIVTYSVVSLYVRFSNL